MEANCAEIDSNCAESDIAADTVDRTLDDVRKKHKAVETKPVASLAHFD